MKQRFCFSLFDRSGSYFMHVCPLKRDEMTVEEMNAIDSLFGSPPSIGNNDESWFKIKKKLKIILGNYEIRNSKNKPIFLIITDLYTLDIKKLETILPVFKGTYITPSKRYIVPLDD